MSWLNNLHLMAGAAATTAALALCALALGLLLAMLLCSLEMQKHWLVRLPAQILITVIRGLPEMLVVLFIYFGSSHALFLLTGDYADVSSFQAGVVALALIFAAYASQTLRAAINAVPNHQREAAKALGIGRVATFFQLVLPQAWRHALPGLGNQWLVLLKDTALVSLIGVSDLMQQTDMIAKRTHEPFTWFMAAAATYLVITLISQRLLKWLRRRAVRFENGGLA